MLCRDPAGSVGSVGCPQCPPSCWFSLCSSSPALLPAQPSPALTQKNVLRAEPGEFVSQPAPDGIRNNSLLDNSPLGLVIDFLPSLPPALSCSPCFSWIIYSHAWLANCLITRAEAWAHPWPPLTLQFLPLCFCLSSDLIPSTPRHKLGSFCCPVQREKPAGVTPGARGGPRDAPAAPPHHLHPPHAPLSFLGFFQAHCGSKPTDFADSRQGIK